MTDSESKPPKEPIPLALRVTVFGVLLLIVLLTMVRALNRASVFPPVPMDKTLAPKVASERDDVREIRIATPDGIDLYGWVQGRDDASRKIIQFGGNGEYVGPHADRYAETIKALDAQFLLFDYRGFANSPGRPNEPGLYNDARAVYHFAVHELNWNPDSVILWGRSLGCAPAIQLASELQAGEPHEFLHGGATPEAIILEAPFLSIKEMAIERMGFLGKPEWLTYFLFDNAAKAPSLNCAAFIFHGAGDEIVPFEQGKKLAQLFEAPAEFMALDGVGHNNIWSDATRASEIRVAINEFLKAQS